MQPGGSLKKFFRRLTAAGVAVTGKVTADFAFTGYYCAPGGSPVATTLAAAVTELVSGWYMVTLAAPPVKSQWFAQIACASGTDLIQIPSFSGETESNDFDALAASVARPLVTITGQGTIGQITPIALVNKRYRWLRFAFNDASGVAIDMTAGTTYTNYVFGVRGYPDQTASKLDATDTLASAPYTWSIVGSLGYVDVKIPENAPFFTLTEGASAADTLELRYELTGDMVSPSGETIPLVQSSQLLITRREVGS